MADKKVDGWLPLEEAATLLNRSVITIKSQMRNGRIQRGRHFRSVGEGQFELNVIEYLDWWQGEKEERKLPFLERFKRDTEAVDKPISEAPAPAPKKTTEVPSKPPKPPAEPKKQPKLIPLGVWAESVFGEHAPHKNTLCNWVKAGKILPMPTKVGRAYFCSPDAEYIDPVVEKIRRMTGIR